MSSIDYLRALKEPLTPGIIDEVLEIVNKENLLFYPRLSSQGIYYEIQRPLVDNGIFVGEPIASIPHQSIPRNYDMARIISLIESQRNKTLMDRLYLG